MVSIVRVYKEEFTLLYLYIIILLTIPVSPSLLGSNFISALNQKPERTWKYFIDRQPKTQMQNENPVQ